MTLDDFLNVVAFVLGIISGYLIVKFKLWRVFSYAKKYKSQ